VPGGTPRGNHHIALGETQAADATAVAQPSHFAIGLGQGGRGPQGRLQQLPRGPRPPRRPCAGGGGDRPELGPREDCRGVRPRRCAWLPRVGSRGGRAAEPQAGAPTSGPKGRCGRTRRRPSDPVTRARGPLGLARAPALPASFRGSGERAQGPLLRRGRTCAPPVRVHRHGRPARVVQVAPRPDVRDEVQNLAVPRVTGLQPRDVVHSCRVRGELVVPVAERSRSEFNHSPPPNANREDAHRENVGTQVESGILEISPPRAQRQRTRHGRARPGRR
jgi:hypothetical protein